MIASRELPIDNNAFRSKVDWDDYQKLNVYLAVSCVIDSD
jgi:hypothetical protein